MPNRDAVTRVAAAIGTLAFKKSDGSIMLFPSMPDSLGEQVPLHPAIQLRVSAIHRSAAVHHGPPLDDADTSGASGSIVVLIPKVVMQGLSIHTVFCQPVGGFSG